MVRTATAVLLCALVLFSAGAARADSRPARHDLPAIRASLGYAPPTPRATAPPSPSSSPASDAANPLGSGAGIVVLVVIGGAFLWLRSRALRR